MAYSSTQRMGDFIDGFNETTDRYRTISRQDKEDKYRDSERDYKSSRQIVTDERADEAYDYAASERDRTKRLRKYRSSMAQFTQSRGKIFKGLIDAFDDPDDDVNYDNIVVNEDGSITASGEGQEDVVFPTLDEFVKITNAEFDPETWHSNRAKEKAEKAANAKATQTQKDKLAIEDRKGQWRVKVEKAKEKAKGATKVPADLQVTSAVFKRMKKLYPKVDPDKLWLSAFKEATKSGETPEQFKASFMGKFVTDATTEYSSKEDVKRITEMAKSTADDLMDKAFGNLDELGFAIPEPEPEPQAAAIQGPLGDGDGGLSTPAETAKDAEMQRAITAARERFPDPRALQQHLMKNRSDLGMREIFAMVKAVFPDFNPNEAGRVSGPSQTPGAIRAPITSYKAIDAVP